MLAAGLTNHFLEPLAGGKVELGAVLVDACPYLLKAMSEKLKELDAILVAKGIGNIEAEGWQLPIAISSIRTWQLAMAAFQGKALANTKTSQPTRRLPRGAGRVLAKPRKPTNRQERKL